MGLPPPKAPPKPDFLASALEAESKSMLKRLTGALTGIFGATDAMSEELATAKKSLEEFAATQIPVDLGDHYMPVGMYLYGGAPSLSMPTSSMKSQQTGTITINDGDTIATATISAVDLGRHDLIWSATPAHVQLVLTSPTTLTATRSDPHGAITVTYEVREYYPTFAYGGSVCSSGGMWDGHFSSSSSPSKSKASSKCSTCGALFRYYFGGTLCSACKSKLDQVMDSSRELSPDEVGRALSEFVRKKLAKIEPVDDVRARGIKLEDDEPTKP